VITLLQVNVMLCDEISPTAPFTFCRLLTKTVVEYEGLSADTAALDCLITTGTVVP
jgi:hypothetical protein